VKRRPTRLLLKTVNLDWEKSNSCSSPLVYHQLSPFKPSCPTHGPIRFDFHFTTDHDFEIGWWPINFLFALITAHNHCSLLTKNCSKVKWEKQLISHVSGKLFFYCSACTMVFVHKTAAPPAGWCRCTATRRARVQTPGACWRQIKLLLLVSELDCKFLLALTHRLRLTVGRSSLSG
jgi:hypothetical protein